MYWISWFCSKLGRYKNFLIWCKKGKYQVDMFRNIKGWIATIRTITKLLKFSSRFLTCSMTRNKIPALKLKKEILIGKWEYLLLEKKIFYDGMKISLMPLVTFQWYLWVSFKDRCKYYRLGYSFRQYFCQRIFHLLRK